MALEWAIHARERIQFFQPKDAARARTSLHELTSEVLREFGSGDPKALAVSIERYIKDILRRTLGNVDAMRGYVGAIVGELLRAIERRAVVDARTLAKLSANYETKIQQAQSVHELWHSFEQIAGELVATLTTPGHADRRERLERARSLLDRGFAEPLTLELVAKRVGFSPTHLSRAFRSHTGVGFARYLLERRLEHAEKLLQSTPLPIQQIATQSGFSSYVHFARAFRAHQGTTARAFRQNAERWIEGRG